MTPTKRIKIATILLSAVPLFGQAAAPEAHAQDTGQHERDGDSQKKDRSFIAKVGTNFVIVDYSKLDPETGMLTVGFITNISPQIKTCLVMEDIVRDMDPADTDKENIERIVTHLQTHGYPRENIAEVCLYAQLMWLMEHKPEALENAYEKRPDLKAKHQKLHEKYKKIRAEYLEHTEEQGTVPQEERHEHDHS